MEICHFWWVFVKQTFANRHGAYLILLKRNSLEGSPYKSCGDTGNILNPRCARLSYTWGSKNYKYLPNFYMVTLLANKTPRCVSVSLSSGFEVVLICYFRCKMSFFATGCFGDDDGTNKLE